MKKTDFIEIYNMTFIKGIKEGVPYLTIENEKFTEVTDYFVALVGCVTSYKLAPTELILKTTGTLHPCVVTRIAEVLPSAWLQVTEGELEIAIPYDE